MTPTSQVLEVWGELACFTRPELKVERFSYPCITPSAARGIFDAIYTKPVEFRWRTPPGAAAGPLPAGRYGRLSAVLLEVA
jgi:CRISPR-associated Cas5-like protein